MATTNSNRHLLAIVTLPLLCAASLHAGQTLYNGIAQPDEWPPRIVELTREPMPVPYLEHRPEVVPIDVGRQLFVDDFLIEQTSLERRFHTAVYHPGCPVLTPDKPWESQGVSPKPMAMVFSDGVWYDAAEKLFKMWYMSGLASSTSYAVSKDGIYWEKPALDVVPGTNIVLKHQRDSTTVWFDPRETDPSRRYKMYASERDPKTHDWKPVLYFSPDGIHWSKGSVGEIMEVDRSTIFFNPFRERWVYSARGYGTPMGRTRLYLECTDLVDGLPKLHDLKAFWTGADRLDPHNPDPALKAVPPELYNLDATPYESIMLGLFSVWQGQPPTEKRNEVLLGFSRDGFHWSRPDRRPFAGVNETKDAWNYANVQSAGGGCLVVGDLLYFYVSGRGKDRKADPASTGLAVLRRDGFASMDAGEKAGTLTTRPLTFKGRHLFVNAEARGGELLVEVLNREGLAISSFGKAECVPVTSDSTIQLVRWKESRDLASLSGEPVRFRFHLRGGKLYSFWVSPQESGASQGYVAAGGPGYTAPIDTVGLAAYPAAAAIAPEGPSAGVGGAKCPAWARETVPAWVQPYLGKYGLPDAFPRQKEALGGSTAGIDMWQANHFVAYRPETDHFLYTDYTPTTVHYRKGTLPRCEKLVAQYTAGLKTDREKALALLTRLIPEQIAHPSIPPYSTDVRPDRAMSEEELLESGMGWCNEQARVFVRLCQVAGIPARMIFLFYNHPVDGHVIGEFYADGRWSMADSSWCCVFPAADGHLMSAAECHQDANKMRVGEAYIERVKDIIAYSDELLIGRRYKDAGDAQARAKKLAEAANGTRNGLRTRTAKQMSNLWTFGVMNSPLPE